MSQWRKIAIEEIPSCKKVIEESSGPCAMWIALYDELISLEPFEEVSFNQIYDFAFRCFRNRKPKVLAAEVWIFFHYVIGGYIDGIDIIRKGLPKRISISDFDYWAEVLKDDFGIEKYSEAKKSLNEAKRNMK